MSQLVDLSGEDIVVDGIYVGASTPGSAGTLLSGTEISALDGVTAGTATASKAVILGASKEIATITTATVTNLTSTTITPTTIAGNANFSGTPTFGAATVTTLTPTTIAGNVNFTGTPTFAAGLTLNGNDLNLNSETVACTGTSGTSTATMTKNAAQVTTASITTAGGATHVITITYTGIAATDLVWVTKAGGTNSATENYSYKAVCTSNTITVTLSNNTAATALNGTCIFNILVCKA